MAETADPQTLTAPSAADRAADDPGRGGEAAGPDLSQLDQQLGDVVVEAEIARTPLAAVYRVRTGARGDRSLALKVTLRPCDPEELTRFRHEVRLLTEARHPNVVEVYDCGALPGGYPFLTMELLAPGGLETLRSAGGDGGPGKSPADWEAFYDLALQAAAGLAHIHRQGVIHHDIKPSNLALAPEPGPEGRPVLKILDFGLAQVVQRGLDSRIRGTLAYTAPEVILQDAYDQRADLYSLGLTLYELATGRLPSAGGRREALAFHLSGERPDPRRDRPDLPEPLAAILGRLMERDPARRHPSAGRLLVDLGEAAQRRVDAGELALGGTLLSSRLVGREPVMDRLRRELAAAAAGEGRVVRVEGDEGLGKSRMLREFRIFAALEGARVGVGRGSADAAAGGPLASVLEGLGRLGVRVEPPPPASEEGGRRERFRVYREIADALRRAAGQRATGPRENGRSDPERIAEAAADDGGWEGGPLVLLLDDLHRAGEEGEELLTFLAPELAAVPVLVVAAREPTAADAAEGVDDTLGLPLPALSTLVLAPLDREGSEELVDACLGSAGLRGLYDVVHRRTGGNPGQIQELLRHLVAQEVVRFRQGEWKLSRTALERWTAAAGSAEDLEVERLERLDPVERRLLEAAAVVGEPFRLGEMARLLGEEPLVVYGPLSALVEHGHLERLREADGAVYTLPRRRLARRLYDGMAREDRQALHRRRAEDLLARAAGEGDDPGDGDPGLSAAIAAHAWEAGERVLALPHLLRAARSAADVYAYAEAARLFGRAAEAAREAPPEVAGPDLVVAAESAHADALQRHGRYDKAGRIYDRLLALPAGGLLADAAYLARLRLLRGRLHRRMGDHEAALESYRAGLADLAAAPEPGSGGSRRQAAPPAASSTATAVDLPPALAAPLPDAEELQVELMRAEASSRFDLGQADEARRRAEEALARADTLGLERQRAQILNGLGLLAYARGDWDQAGRLVRRGLAAAEGLDEDLDEGRALAIHLRQNLGNVLWKTGDYEAAQRAYAENLAHAEATREPWGQLTALNNLGILEASRGDWRAARDPLSRSLEIARRLGVRENEAMARLNLGEVEEMLGDWTRAERHLDRGLARLGEASEHPTRHALLAQKASLARRRGQSAAAEELARRALAGAEESDDRDLAAQCELLLGLVAKDREEWAAAGAHLERAGELAAGSGTRQLLARVRISQADLALRRGAPGAAAAAVEEARDLVEELADRFAGGKLEVMEARLASARGDEEAAGPHHAAAVQVFEELGTPYELGRSLYEWGLRTWNPEQAADRLRRALALFEKLGAEAEVRRARGVLERIEEHGRRGADRDPVLYEVVKVVNSTLDLQEVLDRTMDLVLQHLRAERGMIVLFNPLTRELETAVSRNLSRGRRSGGGGRGGGADEAGELSESVVRRVIERREPVVTMDAQVDQRFRGAESIVASHIISILCVPMSIRDRLEGAIYVDHTRSRGLFEEEDVRFLVAFADQAAVALEKARLYSEQEAARRRLKEENEALKREILSSHHLGSLIGKGRAITELKRTLERVAQSDSTVLIRGESGTGKGLVARIIHNVSVRREGPFVQFNCAALPETLVESELFGHEKGAFTGAAGLKPGRFELADGGTIFLDEVGKISRSVQAKLLRVVEDKRFERVGGTKTLSVDVRIIAATNLQLEDAIERDEFREDLYYRLNIIPIVLPPLRERREDVPYLVDHFLKGISRDLGHPPREIDPDVLDLFQQYDWPGNVRELEAAIHRALVLSSADVLTRADFSWIALKSGDPGAVAEAAVAGASVPELAAGGYEEALARYDRRLLETALEQCNGRIRETARLLGIARNTLKAKMDRYGMER